LTDFAKTKKKAREKEQSAKKEAAAKKAKEVRQIDADQETAKWPWFVFEPLWVTYIYSLCCSLDGCVWEQKEDAMWADDGNKKQQAAEKRKKEAEEKKAREAAKAAEKRALYEKVCLFV
jgi:hypothetical protein